MKKKEENKTIMRQWANVLLIVGVLFLFIGGFVLAYEGMNPDMVDKKELYSYDSDASMDYKVYLKDNSFFTSEYLGMNKQYISSIIDHIDVTGNYKFNSTKRLDYTYNYSIVATVLGSYDDNGTNTQIWSKSYPIFTSERIKGTGSTFSISKPVSLDYNTYNNLMADFKEEFGLSVDARIDLTMNVNINAGLAGDEEKNLNETDKISLKIPLLKQTISISPDYTDEGKQVIYETYDDNYVDITQLSLGIIIMILAVIIFVMTGRKLLVLTKKSEYLITFNKIMKEYGDIIAETKSAPVLKNYDVIKVKSFNELVDIEEELHSPIICYEVKPNSKCMFIILNSGVAYKYELNEKDFKDLIRE